MSIKAKRSEQFETHQDSEVTCTYITTKEAVIEDHFYALDPSRAVRRRRRQFVGAAADFCRSARRRR